MFSDVLTGARAFYQCKCMGRYFVIANFYFSPQMSSRRSFTPTAVWRQLWRQRHPRLHMKVSLLDVFCCESAFNRMASFWVELFPRIWMFVEIAWLEHYRLKSQYMRILFAVPGMYVSRAFIYINNCLHVCCFLNEQNTHARARTHAYSHTHTHTLHITYTVTNPCLTRCRMRGISCIFSTHDCWAWHKLCCMRSAC